jgi:hypothetical protein
MTRTRLTRGYFICVQNLKQETSRPEKGQSLLAVGKTEIKLHVVLHKCEENWNFLTFFIPVADIEVSIVSPMAEAPTLGQTDG